MRRKITINLERMRRKHGKSGPEVERNQYDNSRPARVVRLEEYCLGRGLNSFNRKGPDSTPCAFGA